ncbi:MAG: PilT/PilU family type 4a pilus ATPase [Gammaproteobacteria bacterium]|nr:PilT/PilU family type 4a pilus ATPase [Gammaproteobacteria bacterium]
MNITQLLEMAAHHRASDLHLSVDYPPLIRKNGRLQKLHTSVLSQDDLIAFSNQLTPPELRKTFAEKLDLDFSYHLHPIGRFRVNRFHDQKGIALALRLIPANIPLLNSYKNQDMLRKTLQHSSGGLILLTGATGSGKSTTLAALVEFINTTQALHIITLEDPIEFIYQSKKALIHQREVGRDVLNFHQGLRAALREDPDLILIGELRDLESIRLALQAAETGHLVLATLHANSAAKSIDRLIDSFPGDEKNLIRTILSESLIAIFHQALISRNEQSERQLVQEILINTPSIRNLIREHKLAQIEATMEISKNHGMVTLAQAMREMALN